MRNESDGMVDAFLEAVEAVRGTGARLEISHLKASGRQNFGLTKTLLDLMTYYRRFGMEITCDAYPENYCHTGLASCLPPWARARGHAGFVEMMADGALRDGLVWALDHPATGWENILRDCTAEDTILAESEARPDLQGLTLRQAAERMGLPRGAPPSSCAPPTGTSALSPAACRKRRTGPSLPIRWP
jgi:N-acyl-D-aspartate/D-glutamate deacylase